MRGYFCIGFVSFMLNNKRQIDFTNLFSPNNFKKNEKEMLDYFQQFKAKNLPNNAML